MKVSIIIVNFNGCRFTAECLETIRLYSKTSAEVIVVDNASTDDSRVELPVRFPEVRFLWLPQNRGFGYANNRGAEKATGDILFFLNNDTLLTGDIIPVMSRMLNEDRSIGIAAPKLLNEDGSLQVSSGAFPSIAAEWRTKLSVGNISAHALLQPDWVTGAAFFIRREVFQAIGGFDEEYFMYFEDVDLCKRVADQGLTIRYIPECSLIHLGGKSYGKQDPRITIEYRRSQLRFYDYHRSLIQRVLVRFYLFMKFSRTLFTPSGSVVSRQVIRLLFGVDQRSAGNNP